MNCFYGNQYVELYHYGVLGMKWGIRKARNSGSNYEYRSFGQKRALKKLDKLRAKGDVFNAQRQKEKVGLLKERDLNRENYTRHANIGAHIVRSFMMSPIGNRTYERYRSAGEGRFSSGFMGILSNIPILGLKVVSDSRKKEFERARSGAGLRARSEQTVK